MLTRIQHDGCNATHLALLHDIVGIGTGESSCFKQIHGLCLAVKGRQVMRWMSLSRNYVRYGDPPQQHDPPKLPDYSSSRNDFFVELVLILFEPDGATQSHFCFVHGQSAIAVIQNELNVRGAHCISGALL